MTNAQIIGNAQDALLKAGKIRPTGRVLRAVDGAGNEITVPEPEEIHTNKTWKEMGFQVQRGEKAVCKLHIWKHTTRKVKTEDSSEGETVSQMFITSAAFFAMHQVQPIKA
jgi:hypothetical protein